MARLSFGAPSSSRRRGGTALVAGLGGAALLLCLGRAPSFVAPPGGPAQADSRRVALASLLVPLAGAAAGSPANAVSGVSFTPPDDTWKEGEGPLNGGKGWVKKEGYGVLFVYPTDYKASIKKIGNDFLTPSFRGPPGVEVMKYNLGEDKDELEMSLKKITDNTLTTETFISWITGGQGRTQATRQWYRKVKQNGKEALVLAKCPEENAEKMRPEIEKFFDGVTLA